MLQAFNKGIFFCFQMQMKNLFSGITPGFIPHTSFHKGRWLLSASHPYWYYFLKRKNPNRITNKSFPDSIDEPLKELVQFLHEIGIKTTPSCSGHHFSEKNFDIIYENLEKDKEEIRNGGLKLMDIETGISYLYKNQNYRLPWSRDKFLQDAKAYQQKGIIGIRTGNRKKLKRKLLEIQVEGAEIREQEGIIFIYISENAKGENRETWRKITAEIKNIIGNV
jgi:hypothetical protein